MILSLLNIPRVNIVRVFVLSFGISLIFNYVTGLVLVIAGGFNRPIIMIMILAELTVIMVKNRKFIDISNGALLNSSVRLFRAAIIFIRSGERSVYGYFLKFAVVACGGWGIYKLIPGGSTVFNYPGVVFKLNEWALNWNDGTIPVNMSHYPQLISVNWAFIYKYIGYPIQFFPRLMMPLFLLGILAMLFDLGVTEKKDRYFWAVIYTVLATMSTSREYFISFCEFIFPLAFFFLLPMYGLWLSGGSKEVAPDPGFLILGGVFAAGAAVTRQEGLFVGLGYPLVVFIYMAQSKRLSMRFVKKYMVPVFLLTAAIAGPMYIYQGIQIAENKEKDNVGLVKNITKGETGLRYRAADALKTVMRNYLFYRGRPGVLSYALLAVLLLGALDRRLAPPILIFIIPFFSVWLVYESPSIVHANVRYIYFIVPYAGLSLGSGIEKVRAIIMRIQCRVNG
ncbi:MAG: hypothetical protein JXJ19_06620 [Elusimicrobia bacterium]|nr:hypothetical protein [Elusimicrobiota bacterium]